MTGQSQEKRITRLVTTARASRTRAGAVPSRMFAGTRPLKRWRYVGIFCERFMACAAIVHVGPLKQSFWALYDRDRDELRERTRMVPRRGEVVLEPGRLRVRDRDVSLELELRRKRVSKRCARMAAGWCGRASRRAWRHGGASRSTAAGQSPSTPGP